MKGVAVHTMLSPDKGCPCPNRCPWESTLRQREPSRNFVPDARVLLALGMLLLTGMISDAHAQGYTPIYSLDFGNPVVITDDGTRRTEGTRRRTISLATAVFPTVSFLRSGSIDSRNTSGTDTINGPLLALDANLPVGGPNSPTVDIGGWYFTEYSRDGQDLYQLHARIFTNTQRVIGIQGAVLQSTNSGSDDPRYTVFVVSEYSPARYGGRGRGSRWGVQGGLGIFIDPNFDPRQGEKRTTVDPTGFLSLSLDLGKRYNVTFSQWYLRNRTQDINRVGIGFGYGF